MPLELPLRVNDGAQRYLITIEGQDYYLRAKYAPRAQSVYLDVDDAEERPIVSGVRCVFGFPFTLYNRDERLPAGTFSMIRSSSVEDRCDLEDVGVDVRLYHWTVEELRAGREAQAEAAALTVVPIP